MQLTYMYHSDCSLSALEIDKIILHINEKEVQMLIQIIKQRPLCVKAWCLIKKSSFHTATFK